MSGVVWLRVGALLGGLAVAAGAFGAHSLRKQVEARKMEPRGLEIYQTAVEYQMYHALALVALGLLVANGRGGTAATVAGAGFALGILLFSGSLYTLALTTIRNKPLVLSTPLGGLMFIIGWIALALAATGSRPRDEMTA